MAIETDEEHHGFTREGVAYDVPEPDPDAVVHEDAATAEEIERINDQLEQLGLTLRVDSHIESYVGTGKGEVRYVRPLSPWDGVETAPVRPGLLFDVSRVKKSIQRSSLPPEVKIQCIQDLERVLALFEEEKEARKENLREAGPEVAALDEMFREVEPYWDMLHAIVTVDEARESEIRMNVHAQLKPMMASLDTLRKETDVAQEAHQELFRRFRKISLAVGLLNRDRIERDR
ncbi:MAG: hypothetical protein WDZ93_01995 [Candidatus Paceibacterota bacterium]